MTPRILRSFGVSQESALHVHEPVCPQGIFHQALCLWLRLPQPTSHSSKSLEGAKAAMLGHPEAGVPCLCVSPTLSVHPEAAARGPVLTPFVIGLVSFWFSLSTHEANPRPRIIKGGTPTCQPAFSLLGSSLRPLPLAPKAHCSFLESGHKTAPFQKLFLMFLFLKDQIQFLFPSFAMLDLSCGMRTQDRTLAPCIRSVAS